MRASPQAIDGVWVFEPTTFPDDRGSFTVPFQAGAFRDALGFDLPLAQLNHSVSHRGVVRGVHFADVPPGQGKYVYVAAGAARDVAVDLRVGSPTFGQHTVIELDADPVRAVYLAEGVGHAFQALVDGTIVAYLCATPYRPAAEHGVSPFDPDLALPWLTDVEPVLSAKDAAAPTLAQARERGVLPSAEACDAHTARLRACVTSPQPGGDAGR